jgi:hypothetical protein
LTPLSAAEAGLTPLPAAGAGLTPLPSRDLGLTPLAPGTAGLTPLDGGLTPLGDGLTPLSPLDRGPRSAPGPLDSVLPPAPGGGLGSWGGGTVNPYQSPASVFPAVRRAPRPPSRAVVIVPAIFMIVVSSLTLLLFLYFLVMFLIGSTMVVGQVPEAAMPEALGRLGGALTVIIAALALNGVVLTGAIRMLKFENWGLALTAAIIHILPCSVFFLGTPIGIWALVILCLPGVRKQFD